MNTLQSVLIKALRTTVDKVKFPGRYVITELAARHLTTPNDALIRKIGRYDMELKFGDLIQRQIYFGLYDVEESAFLQKLLKPGDIFFDIGANVGYYTMIASQLVGDSGAIHSFEPMPANVAILRRNLVLNDIKNTTINSVAVGDSEGTLTLYFPDEKWHNSGWATIVPTDRKPNQINVAMVTIDNYVAQNHINRIRLMKLDIEGAEFKALSGMKFLLSSPDAPDLICEISPFHLTQIGKDSRLLTELLDRFGYSIFLMDTLVKDKLDPAIQLSTLCNVFCTKNPSQLSTVMSL